MKRVALAPGIKSLRADARLAIAKTAPLQNRPTRERMDAARAVDPKVLTRAALAAPKIGRHR